MAELASSALRPRDVYALMTSLIVPRPIAWVSTRDAAGHTNLAPFSYWSGVSSDPPLVSISIADRRDGSPKDTLRIARATGCLCINLVEEHSAEVMNQTAAEHPPGTSEIDLLDVATEPCVAIPCVRVRTARAQLECTVEDVHRYGKTSLLIARVVHFHVDDALLEPGEPRRASPHAVAAVARLGGEWYAALGRRFSLERPKV